MSNLKPCPFCGNKYINLELIRAEDSKGIDGAFIECPVCGIETMIFEDPDKAIEFWNTRNKGE